MRSVATVLAGLSLCQGVRADEPEDAEAISGDTEAQGESLPGEIEPPDEDARAGYIPGYKRVPNLSLSPFSPQTAAVTGNTTIPFYAPSEDGGWQFKFSGYASASLRLSTGERENPTDDQSSTTVHASPRTVDFFGAFNGTNVTPGSWTDLHFQYGNETVQAHVTLTTWKPGLGSDYIDIRSMNLPDQAYVHYNTSIVDKLNLTTTVGAFRASYGGLGQYGAGQYNTFIIGMPFGVGGMLNLTYDINPDWALQLEHGFMGRLGKPAAGSGPTPFSTAQTASAPASFVHHAHLGLAKKGDIPWVLSLHYLSNWSQDETDQVDDPRTYWVDEGVRPDAEMRVLGADLRMMQSKYGNLAVAVARMDAEYAALLSGMGFFGATSGEELTKRFLGQVGGGTGNMWVGGVEYTISWAKFLYHPDPFWGEGPDLITSVFANAGVVDSKDRSADGRKMLKFGSELTYQFLTWAGVSGRYDHVIPSSKDAKETFDVASLKLLLRSKWITHEQVTLSYTRWFYGQNTYTEFPYELPRDELDDQMFALHVGIWW
jgi:hypothetical protein